MPTIEDSIALTDDVMAALAEIASRSRAKKRPDINGEQSLKGLRRRIAPVYDDLQQPIQTRLQQVQAFHGLRVYKSPFWHRHPKGAYLKDYVWLHAEQKLNKRDGRLQAGFSPQGTAYGEYVANPDRVEDGSYQINKLSNWFRGNDFLKQFMAGLKALPDGFEFHCKCAGGAQINTNVSCVPDYLWASLSKGLDTTEYFVISRHHNRENLRRLTVGQLADLLVADISALSGLYPLLQGKQQKLSVVAHLKVDETVQSVRTVERESELQKSDLNDLVKLALTASESTGQTTTVYYSRDPNVAAVVKKLANGHCDLCHQPAPFISSDGIPFLEPHHIDRRADGGADKIFNVVALCPNCHRKIHHLKIAEDVLAIRTLAKRRFDDLMD